MKNKTFIFEEHPFVKKSQGISKTNHEVLLLMNFLQTKPRIKNINIKYYDLFYTAIKTRDEKEIVNIEKEDNEIDYINYEDFISPYQFIGTKNINEILMYRNIRSQINHFNELKYK